MQNERISKLKPMAAVLGVFSLAVFYRFFRLDFQSLWLDELAQTIFASQETLKDVFIETNKHPHLKLFPVLGHAFISVFGDSPSALRLPSALAGSLTVLVTFFLGKRNFNFAVGLLAAIFVGFSWPNVYFSQDVTPYALESLLSVSLVHLVLTGNFFQTASRRNLIATFAVAALLIYNHYFSYLLIATLGIVSLAASKEKKKTFLQLSLLAFFLFLLFIPQYAKFKSDMSREAFWIPKPVLKDLAQFYFHHFKSFVLAVVAAPILGFGFYKAFREASREKKFIALAFIYLIPILIVFIKSQLSVPLFLFRYFFIVIPLFYVLLAYGFWRLWVLPKPWLKTALAAYLIYFILFLPFSWKYYSVQTKQQYKDAVNFILNQDPNVTCDRLVLNDYDSRYLAYYFSQRGVRGIEKCQNLHALTAPVSLSDHFWLLQSAAVEVDEGKLVAGREKTAEARFIDLKAQHFGPFTQKN